MYISSLKQEFQNTPILKETQGKALQAFPSVSSQNINFVLHSINAGAIRELRQMHEPICSHCLKRFSIDSSFIYH